MKIVTVKFGKSPVSKTIIFLKFQFIKAPSTQLDFKIQKSHKKVFSMKNVAIIILTSIEHIFDIHLRRDRNGLRSRIFSTKHLLLFISSFCGTTASSKSGCIIQKHVCKSHESMIDSAQVRFDTKMIYSLNVRRKLRY